MFYVALQARSAWLCTSAQLLFCLCGRFRDRFPRELRGNYYVTTDAQLGSFCCLLIELRGFVRARPHLE